MITKMLVLELLCLRSTQGLYGSKPMYDYNICCCIRRPTTLCPIHVLYTVEATGFKQVFLSPLTPTDYCSYQHCIIHRNMWYTCAFCQNFSCRMNVLPQLLWSHLTLVCFLMSLNLCQIFLWMDIFSYTATEVNHKTQNEHCCKNSNVTAVLTTLSDVMGF